LSRATSTFEVRLPAVEAGAQPARAAAVGPQLLLVKPIDVRELVQAIARNQRGLSADQKIA
jgi:hypothetical protein